MRRLLPTSAYIALALFSGCTGSTSDYEATAGHSGSSAAGSSNQSGLGGQSGGSSTTSGGNQGTGAGSSGGGQDGGSTSGDGLLGAAPVVVEASVNVNSSTADRIKWTDAGGEERTASIVQATGHPSYVGGYLTQFTYATASGPVTCNEPGGGLSGLGLMANHGGGDPGWVTSKEDGVRSSATSKVVFAGKNHVIYEVDMDMHGDHSNTGKGTWHVRWHYVFRTAADYYVQTISYDTSSKPAGTWGSDSRSPYCEFNWTGTNPAATMSEPIDGVEWAASDSSGKSFIFRTRGSSPFSQGYTYDTPGDNIPYTLQWKNDPDRSIGYVSTLDLTQAAAAGGYLGDGANFMKIGSQSSRMPDNWAANYQANGYQGWYGNKMTWQLPFGAIGGGDASGNFPDWTWRRNWKGYPTVGTTLLVLLDPYSKDGVRTLVAESAAIHKLAADALKATTGQVVTTGKQDLQAADGFVLKPAGYNHLYHTWDVVTAGNDASVTLSLGEATLTNPTFVFHGYEGSDYVSITLAGQPMTEGKDVFTSIDGTGKRLFATFARSVSGDISVALDGT